MSSILQWHNSSKTESQKTGYYNYFDYSLVKVDGNYIPSWYLSPTSLNTRTVYLEELTSTALYNGEIDIISSDDITTGGYTTSQDLDKSLIWADRQAETLSGIHRMKMIIAAGTPIYYYSDIFYNIDSDIPLYIRKYNLEYIRIYRY